MDWNIPCLPEGSNSLGIPPVAVKLPVPKHQYLSSKVHDGMEQQVKSEQPEQMVGKLEWAGEWREKGNILELIMSTEIKN